MGERFGNYEIMRRLAAGGMAEVLLAKHKSMGGFERLVCLKRILPHLSAQEEFLKMFQDEARIAANLIHPNIAQIYDISAADEHYYIAMEYVRGEDLRRVYNQEVSQGRAMPQSTAALIIMGAAAGLDYAHRQTALDGSPLNIVHRDISPQNILVTYDGHVKIIDFGVAKAAGKLNHTRAGVLKGKYSYMSPEQASGDPIDGRTDIFALGTTLYEITTGTRLFKRDNELETLHAVIACNVPKPTDVVPGYDQDLENIVLRALAYDVDHRYTTAGEMEQDLERYLLRGGQPTSASSLASYMQDLFAEKLADEALFGGPPWQENATHSRLPFVRATSDAVSKTRSTIKSAELPPKPPDAGLDEEKTTVDEPVATPDFVDKSQGPVQPTQTISGGTPVDWQIVEGEENTTGAASKRQTTQPLEQASSTEAVPPHTAYDVPVSVPAHQATLLRKKSGYMGRLGGLVFFLASVASGAIWLRQHQKTVSAPSVEQTLPASQGPILKTSINWGEPNNQSVKQEQPFVPPVEGAAALLDVLAPTPMAVTLGGRYLGDTPLLGLRLAPGTIRLRLEDHDSGLIVRRSTELSSKVRSKVEVVDRRGELKVQAQPWAWVQLGQRPAHETPVELALIEGAYLVTLECPDGRRHQQQVHIVAGQTEWVRIDCTSPASLIK